MSSALPAVSDMLLTVKSREVQRGMLAEMSGDFNVAAPHYLAAAHLEIVLANDYSQAGERELARRSRLSAASCFWRAGSVTRAREILDEVADDDPSRGGEVQAIRDDLQQRSAI